MAVSIEDIKKLRAMTGAGLADVKNALNESEGDFDKAKEILRERGLAIAAKRSDRETSNGCVLVKAVDGFAAMVAVKCETDFVANGKDFIAMVQEILDAATTAFSTCSSLVFWIATLYSSSLTSCGTEASSKATGFIAATCIATL